MTRLTPFDELLGFLPESRRGELAEKITEREYRAGETVFHQGDPPDILYGVIQGRVKIVLESSDGQQVILRVIAPPALFGEIAVLDGRERTAGAVVVSPARLGLLKREALVSALMACPEFSLGLIQLLCARLRHVNEVVESNIFLNASARLAKCLWHLAQQNGVPTPSGIRLGLRFSQHDLAGMVATSRELVNKQLKHWERDGVVKLQRGSVVEVNPVALAELCGELSSGKRRD